MRSRYLHGASVLAVALGFGAWVGSAAAQPTTTTQVGEVEVIATTGSYIARETTALPVDVLSNQELEAQGSPTVVQLVKTISSSSSGLGESNRYNGGAGTASINLRGFGASRTLVLMNGRRMANTPFAAFQGGGANLNFIPQAAVGRVEILKDGAAATYGSEAIGGVVNFITRTDLNGFEVNGEYSAIHGSETGDYQGSIAWGHRFENGNVLLTAGYRHRGRVDVHDTSYGILPYTSPNYGGWSGNSNPGNYVANTVGGALVLRDNGCTELGGQLTNTISIGNDATGANVTAATPIGPGNPQSATSACRFQFTNFNDIVNEENHFQLYGEVNFDLNEHHRFHGEVAWARDDVPNQRISPANGNTQFPTPTSLGGTSGSVATPGALNFFVRYNVPANNPGLLDLRATCAAPLTAAQCTAAGAAGGLDISQTAFRFIANAGHPLFADGADHQQVNITAFRVSGGFSGDMMWGLRYDTNLLYMENRGQSNISDLLVNRIQESLNGFGSQQGAANQCTQAEMLVPGNAGSAAAGCFFFNPFTNSVAVSATNGLTNPYFRGGANAAVRNDPLVVANLYGNYTNIFTNQVIVGDAVVTGNTPLTLPGGTVQFALGTQYRFNREIAEYGTFFNNQSTPCVDSISDSTPVCGAPNGPLIFFGSNRNRNDTRTAYAVFGEVRFPILDNLEATLAGRYEHYDHGIGSTSNPKLSLRWQAMSWLAFRASAGTTFRAPEASTVTGGCAIGVANLGGQYRAVQTCANPALVPETANAYNVGFIVQGRGFNATLDYFLFEFSDELTIEGSANLFAAMFPGNSNVNCGAAAFAPLQTRFQFAGGNCAAANVLRIDTFNVNGPSTRTSGLDFHASYDWHGWFDGSYQAGVEGTYLLEVNRGAFSLLGAPQVVFATPFDRAGTHDLQSQFFSYPRLKVNGWLTYHRGPLNIRWQTRFSEGTRAAINTADDFIYAVPVDATNPTGFRQRAIGKLDNFWQHDITARYDISENITVTASVQNILDEDPPFAPSNFNYDYTTGNPLGRVFEIGARLRY